MAYQRAYCFSNEFNQLLVNNSNDILEKILNDFCDVYLDLDEEEILNLIEENPIFKSFSKREIGSVIPAKVDLDNIKNNDFIPYLNDILVLNENFKTDEIRANYGILAIKPDEIQYLESLDFHFGYSFQKNEINDFNSWEEVFSLKPLEPLNSAILIDNHFWSNLENFHEENLENLYPIFENLIPKTLKVPFHLSIVTSNNKSLLNKKFNEKLNKIVKNLRTKTGVNVEISLSTHTDIVKDELHERVIMTNYHYIYSDKGFNVFKDKKIILSTKGDRNWVFKDVKNYYGQIRKHQHFQNIQLVKKRITQNQAIDNEVIFNIGNTNNSLLN
ncbi:hypothetical protein FBBAL38_13035 [Flavobacteria bacterium BAL38]|nr:hypothetical protein FBBAL38_13035 [Flavobacteria bacterium BAL38]